MHIVDKYRELGSYRTAGRACGVDHKTVKAVVDRVERRATDAARVELTRSTPSILDEHYGGARGAPQRAVRPRTATEQAFLALGAPAEAFLRAAAAAGQSRLPAHLADIVALEAAHGRDVVVAALERALTFRRFTAGDVRAIIAAGPDAPAVTEPGRPLNTRLPATPSCALDVYAPERLNGDQARS